MERYVSMWSSSELKEMSRKEIIKRIGIIKDKVIVQPPICKKCGGYCIEVDLGTMYLVCLDCNHTEEETEIESVSKVRLMERKS